MPLTLPGNIQTFTVGGTKTGEQWVFSPSYWYSGSAGATDEWAFQQGAIPNGWVVYQCRAAINSGNTPGVTSRGRLTNSGVAVGADVVVPSGAGDLGGSNAINYSCDTGFRDVGNSPMALAAFLANFRYRHIADGGNFSYHADGAPTLQVKAAPFPGIIGMA